MAGVLRRRWLRVKRSFTTGSWHGHPVRFPEGGVSGVLRAKGPATHPAKGAALAAGVIVLVFREYIAFARQGAFLAGHREHSRLDRAAA